MRIDPDQVVQATTAVLERIDGMAWWSDRMMVTRALAGLVPALIGPASGVDRSRAGQAWFSQLDRGRQVILGSPDHRPEPAALVPDDRAFSWIPWRLPQTLTTSEFLSPDVISPSLFASEIVDAHPDPLGLWSAEVEDGATVVEIQDVDDWTTLCERFPRVIDTPDDYRLWGATASRALVPDWRAVARQFDGVHVSMGGLLTATGSVRDVGGAQCVLDDIDSELTAWLRPAIRVGERIGVAGHHDLQSLLT